MPGVVMMFSRMDCPISATLSELGHIFLDHVSCNDCPRVEIQQVFMTA